MGDDNSSVVTATCVGRRTSMTPLGCRGNIRVTGRIPRPTSNDDQHSTHRARLMILWTSFTSMEETL